MDKVISGQHIGLINMEMIRREYRKFEDIHLRAIGINPKKSKDEKLSEFIDYYEEQRHRSRKEYRVSELAGYFNHYYTINSSSAAKYTVFSDGEHIYGIGGWLDKHPRTVKLYILGEGKMKEYLHSTIELPHPDYYLKLWHIEILNPFQEVVSGPVVKYISDTTINPDIYKHCITKADFKQFCQRCEMLEMLNI